MIDKLLVIAKKDVSLSQLDALKNDEAVRHISGSGKYLVIVASPTFKTDIRHLDVDKTFSILFDQPAMLCDGMSDEEFEEISTRHGNGRIE